MRAPWALHPQRYNHAMESDRVNTIENALHDLTARASELRRYL